MTIDKAAGSSLAYATGTLKNETDRQRFGVTPAICARFEACLKWA